MRILVKKESEDLSEGFLSNLFKKISRKDNDIKVPEKSDNKLEDYFKEINSIVKGLKEVKKLSDLANDYYKGQFPKEINEIIFSKGYSLEKFIESFYRLDDNDKAVTLTTLNSIQGSLRDLKKELNSNQYSTFLKSEVFFKKRSNIEIIEKEVNIEYEDYGIRIWKS